LAGRPAEHIFKLTITGCLKKAVKSTFDGNFFLQDLMKIDMLERYWDNVLEHVNLSLRCSKSQFSTPLSLCGTEIVNI